MMRSILYFLACFFVLSVRVSAQQESQFTMFMYNTQWLNPGYVGSRNLASVQALVRTQWQGFEGAPQSQVVSFNAPFFNKRVGFGLTAFHRTIGIDDQVYGNIAYSYALVNKPKFSLRGGLQGSAKRYAMDFASPLNVAIIPTDPTMISDKATSMVFNVGAGLYATFGDAYFGVSVPALLNNDIGFLDGTLDTSATEQRHIYGVAGAMFPLSSTLMLKPAVQVKVAPNSPFDIDFNAMVFYNLKIGAGISYRLGGDMGGLGESLDLLLHYQLSDKLGIGAAYDYSLSRLKVANKGSFELFLRYDIGSEKVIMTNPRTFLR